MTYAIEGLGERFFGGRYVPPLSFPDDASCPSSINHDGIPEPP